MFKFPNSQRGTARAFKGKIMGEGYGVRNQLAILMGWWRGTKIISGVLALSLLVPTVRGLREASRWSA